MRYAHLSPAYLSSSLDAPTPPRPQTEETGTEKGQGRVRLGTIGHGRVVKFPRENGSSGWTRTSNPRLTAGCSAIELLRSEVGRVKRNETLILANQQSGQRWNHDSIIASVDAQIEPQFRTTPARSTPGGPTRAAWRKRIQDPRPATLGRPRPGETSIKDRAPESPSRA